MKEYINRILKTLRENYNSTENGALKNFLRGKIEAYEDILSKYVK
jgi:hypothetical protein